MSAASLLKVYDGQDPELAFLSAGNAVTLAAVLTEGNSAGTSDIDMNGKSLLDLLDITGTNGNRLDITSGTGQGVKVEGLNGASLVASGGGAKVEASAGVLELNFDGAGGALNIVPLGTAFTDITSTAAGAKVPNYSGATKQLEIQVGGVAYYIALNPTPFT